MSGHGDLPHLSDHWSRIVAKLSFAFQPIANVHTGSVFGFEALLRGHAEAGFASIADVFDQAYDQGVLFAVDIALREAAIRAFAESSAPAGTKLFYNLDNRILELPETCVPETERILRRYGLENGSLYFEISERHHVPSASRISATMQTLRRSRFKLAVDDFGSGYSGLQLLYNAEPDVIKLDRFLIADVDGDPKRKVFVATTVSMAHITGVLVVAEGIETEGELRLCRDIGVDYVQGYLLGRPTTDHTSLAATCDVVTSILTTDRRNRDPGLDVIVRKMDRVEPIRVTERIIDVLDRFRKDQDRTLFPVVSEYGEALGVLREADLKRYVYSPFGISLLQNRSYPKDIESFTSRAPMADIHSRMEKVIEAYAINEDAEAVVITDDGKYCGLLYSRALIEAMNERRVEQARDQNPLSRLPGNHSITEYLSHALARPDPEGYAFAYLDFDNFKAFNDVYGFRLGDRAIVLFGDLLREIAARTNVFVGHIGGDDFFVGVSLGRLEMAAVIEEVRRVRERFAETASRLYSDTDRSRGYILAAARDGRRRRFPLLSVSAAILEVPASQAGKSVDPERFSERIAAVKSRSKHGDGFVVETMSDGQPNLPEM